MKNIIKELIFLTLLVFYLTFIITNNTQITIEITNCVNIWITKILPTLFPTFIIMDILSNTDIIFNINKKTKLNIFSLLSIVSGSPSNAFFLNNFNQDITKHLSTNTYISLAFIINSLNKLFNYRITIIIIISNIISNIILSFIIKPSKLQYPKNNNYDITSSIKKTTNSLISILGTIIFINTLPIHLIKNTYIKALIYSILEITSSFNYLANLKIDNFLKIIYSLITISFCGISIHLQIKSSITSSNLNYKKYLIHRLIHFIIFLFITITLLFLTNNI